MSFLPVDFWERFVYIDGVVNWMEYFMGDRSVSVRACLMARSIYAAQLSFRHDRDRAGKEEEWIFNICCFFNIRSIARYELFSTIFNLLSNFFINRSR